MIQHIVTIVMGTVIGYGTNYLAVKMLFRPKREIKAFGKTLPFTPGVIPKQKSQLAKSVGNAVGNKLLTKDVIKQHLLDDRLKSYITGSITGVLSKKLGEEIQELWKLDEESYSEKKTALSAGITKLIMDSINSMGIGKMVSENAPKAFSDWVKAEDGFKRRLLNNMLVEDVLKAFAEQLGSLAQKFVEENGAVIIRKEVDKKIDETDQCTPTELLEKIGFTEDKLLAAVSEKYDEIVDSTIIDDLLGKLDIPKMVQEKIDEMDIDMLEELVLNVMKNQLDMIVNLGAVLGFFLALINVSINVLFST